MLKRKPVDKATAFELRARSALSLNSGLITFFNISIGLSRLPAGHRFAALALTNL